jgi:hypothetical protein
MLVTLIHINIYIYDCISNISDDSDDDIEIDVDDSNGTLPIRLHLSPFAFTISFTTYD